MENHSLIHCVIFDVKLLLRDGESFWSLSVMIQSCGTITHGVSDDTDNVWHCCDTNCLTNSC